MTAKQVGSRPTKAPAKGKSPSFNKTKTNVLPGGGSSTTKQQGTRPVPGVPRHHPPTATVPGAVKRPIKHTPMSRPKAAANSALKGRKGGGGSY